jgi:DNA-binding beta-propeller fold protein YncE
MSLTILLVASGSYGHDNGNFAHPGGVAVDQSGNIFVADTLNYRIQKFDPSFDFMVAWGSGVSDGELSYPSGVALDSSDNVYVSDIGQHPTVDDTFHRIQKFDSNGNFITKWGSYGTSVSQFTGPMGIASDSSGNTYVSDLSNSIKKFDINGNFISIFGSYGSGAGQFFTPYGVALDASGNIYVADEGNNRIQKFASNGSFITEWGSYGTGDGQFAGPVGIAVDPSGYVYVADHNNNRIQKFDGNGNFIGKWGSYGTGDGEFYIPTGVAVDSTGVNVYVTDSGNHRVQKFSVCEAVNLTASAGPGGSISSTGTKMVCMGTDKTFAITPDPCYHVADVLVDGSSVGAVTSYTFTDVTTNHTISASFAINIYSITATTGIGGSIKPSGTLTANCGSNQMFTVAADTYYRIAAVMVDGTAADLLAEDTFQYIFDNVTANHAIAATFAAVDVDVTSPKGGEIWAIGTSQTISWTYINDPGKVVSIELLKGGVLLKTINPGVAIGKDGSGSYSWHVQSKLPPGDDYQIRITSTTNSAYFDTGNYFTIQ